MSVIRDPSTGKGQVINDEGQAHTLSEIQTEARHVSGDGKVIIINSGPITTTASTTHKAVLFVKNTSTIDNLHFGLIKMSATVAGEWRWVKNPTSISNTGTAPSEENFNFASNSVATLSTSSGSATSDTTGGTDFVDFTGAFFGDMTGSLILGAGDAIAFEFALESGTTQGKAFVTILVWTVSG